MKFQPDTIDNANAIDAYVPHHSITVNGQVWASSLLLPSQGVVRPWHCAQVTQLNAAHLEALLDQPFRPEVVLLGTGSQQSFLPSQLLRVFAQRGFGLEVMNTAAACRTYNVLVSEHRRVVAGLLLGPHHSDAC